jgi:5-methyltetrahydropteroyltriglutamate--homocysteine methyltransferase
MRRSTDRILTTHVGALPAPEDVWGEAGAGEARLAEAVAEVVLKQREVGVDLVNEGEYTKGGNWLTFVNSRLQGYAPRQTGGGANLLTQSEDWKEFSDYYERALAKGTLFEDTGAAPRQERPIDYVCTGEVTYRPEPLQRELKVFAAALGDIPASDAFLTSTAPSSIETSRPNDFYKTEEQYVFALAEALGQEYEAIAAAGFNVQVDDAWLPALWDRIGVGMGLKAYKGYCMVRVEALNHALRKVPEDQVRYHLCWGSWHGPHAHDIPLADIVDVMLSVKAQTYLFEAANVRHEHEVQIWETVKLPDGKILAPGVVTHSTPLIEHPELVSTRLQRFARLVGRENVIASTDCGLGLRCHPQVAWAKLKALRQGADLASQALWGKKAA